MTNADRLAGLNKTKTQLIAEDLRRALVSGEIADSRGFNIRAIAESYGTSITPVREALRLLEAEGLIVRSTHRAVAVLELSATDAEELYALRSRIESLATERAASRMRKADEDRLLDLHVAFVTAVRANDFASAQSANEAWHFHVYACGSSELTLRIARMLWSRVDWSSTWKIPGRVEHSVKEHARINAALQRKTVELSGRLMAQHIARSCSAAMKFRSTGNSGTSDAERLADTREKSGG